MRLLFTFTLLLILVLNAWSQDSTKMIKKDSTFVIRKHIPSTATKRSALIPGWGQAYNKQYWKIPLVYGVIAIPTATYIYNNEIHNTLDSPSIEIDLQSGQYTNISHLVLSNNRVTSALNGIEITTYVDANLDLNLTGNNMNVAGIGYSLSNLSTRNFWLQSPNLQLSGVEKINTGSFVVDGITYTTYSPPPTNP